METETLAYETADPVAESAVRLPVVCSLVFVQLVGVIAGQNLWPLLFRGKDPQIELAIAHGAGFAVLAVLCFVLKKRLTRFRLLDLAVAFTLGVLSSAAGMAWGYLNGYGT